MTQCKGKDCNKELGSYDYRSSKGLCYNCCYKDTSNDWD